MQPGVSTPTQAGTATQAPPSTHRAALSVVTTLFFMWGFLTCLNDILIPHLKSIFDLGYRQASLVQFAFFGAYFLFSIPSAKIVDWIGYQRSMVVGLLTMGLGAFLFVPAASVPSFNLFLGALIVLAAGITCLQVAANPYVSVLGAPETASSRLNLTQAFNSLGTFLAPFFGGLLILSADPKTIDQIRALAPDALQTYRLHEAATVKTPYVGLGIALVILAIAIGSFKLPKIEHAQHRIGEKLGDSIWRHPNLVFGAIAIFAYVGAEVSIGSFMVNYFNQPEIGGLTQRVAAGFVALYWGSAMVGRFIGSALLRGARTLPMAVASVAGALMAVVSYWLRGRVDPGSHAGVGAVLWQLGAVLISAGPLFALVAILAALFAITAAVRGGSVSATTGTLLGVCALAATALVATSSLSLGQLAMWSVILVGLFNSIMFPSIFTLGIAELGPLTGDGSGLLVMAIVGGAIIPYIFGAAADRIGIHHAFVIPIVCYLYIAFYAFKGSKPVPARAS